jgi:hypothetical protein
LLLLGGVFQAYGYAWVTRKPRKRRKFFGGAR